LAVKLMGVVALAFVLVTLEEALRKWVKVERLERNRLRWGTEVHHLVTNAFPFSDLRVQLPAGTLPVSICGRLPDEEALRRLGRLLDRYVTNRIVRIEVQVGPAVRPRRG
jgi:hypothetical protein